jgi:hypothetical protein
MKVLLNTTDYNETMRMAQEMNAVYDKSVLFHAYWNGVLNEKHLYSIQSCYHFNVQRNKHKIILWLENNIPNHYNAEIEKYAEIRYFSLDEQVQHTFLETYKTTHSDIIYYSDFIRSLLLYNYGGVWFDLDCFFLRSFDPIFCHYEKDICVYQWENQNYPNNAIYMSLEAKSVTMQKNIEYIIERNKGWGFQEAELTYDLPLNMLVLPCSWFDADWLQNPYSIGTNQFFENSMIKYNFDNFFKGAFCYHWHNKWNKPIEPNSIISQLIDVIINK